MKKLSHKFALLLLTLTAVLSGCSKTDVAPQVPAATPATGDAVATTYMAKGYLFVRLPGPAGLGHTGVGYEIREMQGTTITRTYTYCGGVEGWNSLPYIAPGLPNGGWSQFGYNNNTSMLNVMRSPNSYTNYKFSVAFRAVTLTQIYRAEGIINNFSRRGYNVNGNNCMNAAYEVLNALSMPGMAWPSTNWFPRDQYSNTVTGWSGSRTL